MLNEMSQLWSLTLTLTLLLAWSWMTYYINNNNENTNSKPDSELTLSGPHRTPLPVSFDRLLILLTPPMVGG